MSEPIIVPEVLPPGSPVPPTIPYPAAPPASHAPFHPLSATLLILFDNLWMLEEWAVITWIFTIPLSFLSVFVPVYWIQRRKQGDRRGVAIGKALFLGLVAAVPFSVTGTPVGLALLAWAGLKHPWKTK
jgi:hypothetical protein